MPDTQIRQMRQCHATATKHHQQGVQANRIVAVYEEAADPEQQQARNKQGQRSPIPMPAIAVQQDRERQGAGTGDENTLEQVIGQKTQAERRQHGKHERQGRAMQGADERSRRADAIGEVRQGVAMKRRSIGNSESHD